MQIMLTVCMRLKAKGLINSFEILSLTVYLGNIYVRKWLYASGIECVSTVLNTEWILIILVNSTEVASINESVYVLEP